MSKHSYCRVLPVLIVGLLLSVVLASVLVAQTPAPTPAAAATPESAPSPVLGLGFGAQPKVVATPIPIKALSGEQNALGRTASQIKLHKLTAEDRKQPKGVSTASSVYTEDNKPGEPSGGQKRREEAMAEYYQTTEPLFQQLNQVDGQCRACRYTCQGWTQGSTFTTDSNGNLVVAFSSIDNSTTTQCRNCTAMCYENLNNLARQINTARDTAVSKGVFRHELDSHHLVFSNVKD
jgi:hypothetical protein